jgi:hypothetical protein
VQHDASQLLLVIALLFNLLERVLAELVYLLLNLLDSSPVFLLPENVLLLLAYLFLGKLLRLGPFRFKDLVILLAEGWPILRWHFQGKVLICNRTFLALLTKLVDLQAVLLEFLSPLSSFALLGLEVGQDLTLVLWVGWTGERR